MGRIAAVLAALVMFVGAPLHAQGKVRVKAHVTKKGAYIAPHVRTAPNKKRTDNWPSKPNVNPYTGKKGTVDPYRMKSPRPKVQSSSKALKPRLYAAPRKRRVSL
jgi:hypothetical protein